jgi:hypothetical protein
MVSYHLPCHWDVYPWTSRRRSHQVPMDSLIWRGIHLPGKSGWGPWMHNGTQWGTGTSEGRGASFIRLVRTQVQIQACPRRQKERLITSQRLLVTTSNPGETVSLRFRKWGGSTVPCECESAGWDVAQLHSWSKWGVSRSLGPWQTHKVKGEP